MRKLVAVGLYLHVGMWLGGSFQGTQVDAQSRFIRGDCNNDGFVGNSVSDSVFYFKWAFGTGATPECMAACDVDGDGFVGGSVNDAVYYLNWVFVGGPPPDIPYPDCGPGTAADDALGCETSPVACEPPPEEVCDNSLDDDGDGLADCADPECSAAAGCSELFNIETVVDDLSTQRQSISIDGGSLSLLTSQSAQITLTAPVFAVVEPTEFSMSDIVSISGFPEGVNVLAAVQLGPAGALFAQPIELRFDLTGMRTPGTALAAFITDNDGEDLRIALVTDANDLAGLIETARDGDQVSLSVFSFSNVYVSEIPESVLMGSLSTISQEPDVEIPPELVRDLLNAALDADLDLENAEDVAHENLRQLVIARRMALGKEIDEFINREIMKPDFLLEFFEIVYSALIVDLIDLDCELTSEAEYVASQLKLVRLAEVYGAGLHLACFANPDGLNEVLSDVATVTLLRLGPIILRENADATLEDVADAANTLGRCFSQPILDAYFESFALDVLDAFNGMVTNVQIVTTDNIRDEQKSTTRPDIPTRVRFLQPRLISETPLRIEFEDLDDVIFGVYNDTVEIIFDAPAGNVRSGQINLAHEGTNDVPTSPVAQQDGERPVITFSRSSVASGTVRLTPTSFTINYSFDILMTNNGLVENTTQRITGDVGVLKTFTPRSLADEIDLEEP